MDSLLAHQAEQLELEHKRHLEREQHLLSQINMLLRHIGNAHPEDALPVRSAQAATSPGGRMEETSPGLRIEEAVTAIRAGPGNGSRGTFNKSDADFASSEVLQAMHAVRDGADVLSDEDLSTFTAPIVRTRGGGGSSGGKGEAAAVAAGDGGKEGAAKRAHANNSSASGVASMPQAATAPIGTKPAGNDAAEQIPVEVSKAPPDGPPPLLKQGDDDIFWVSELHVRCCSALDEQ
jgi:hypothetical protein